MDKELTEEEIKLLCTVLQEKLSKLAQQRHNDVHLTPGAANDACEHHMHYMHVVHIWKKGL
jgi:hypothetical protein